MKDSKQAEIAKIHIAKKDLGLDDETYRSLILMISHGRTDSSKELDHAERALLLDHYKARGWKPKQNKPNVANIKKPLISKMAALLTDMKLSWAYADGIAKQMFQRDKVQWCSAQELRGIVTALVNKQNALNKQNAKN